MRKGRRWWEGSQGFKAYRRASERRRCHRSLDPLNHLKGQKITVKDGFRMDHVSKQFEKGEEFTW